MRTTIKDVAKSANVSVQTVSYIINNKRKFSDELESRVQAVIKEMNFKPDMLARSLTKKKTDTVFMIVNDLANPTFSEIINGFEEKAFKKGYSVIVSDIKSNFKNQISEIISRRVDGVYLSLLPSINSTDLLKELLNSEVKILLGNEYESIHEEINQQICYAIMAFDKALASIYKYLVEKGHKKIAYLSGLAIRDYSDKRAQAFIDVSTETFGEKGIIIENEYPYETTIESGKRLAEKLLKTNPRVTAVIATNDLMAYGAMNYFLENGIRVPDDISVVGIDNIEYSAYVYPTLTSIGFDKKKYGEVCFDILFKSINDSFYRNEYQSDFQIYERNSVKDLTKLL